jgi:imidazolonepropionase-like amidohydrolase
MSAQKSDWGGFVKSLSAVVALVAVLGVGTVQKSAGETRTTVIHAGHLIAEPGKAATTNQSIVIQDGKIIAIKDGFISGDTVIDLKDSWVMPGLIDMHTHVTGVLDLEQPIQPVFIHAYMGRPSQIVLDMLPRVRMLLLNGFTTIRNLGDPSSTVYDLRDAINKGYAAGPRIIAIEPQVGVEGGDYDASRWELRRDLEQYVTNRGNCSGVVECTKVVREEVNRGADVIKLRQASALAPDPKVEMVESEAEIKAIIDTAHKLNRKVAVHVIGSPAFLHMVIADGADTIEHGPIDDDAITLMKKCGTAYTPTLLAGKLIDYHYAEGVAGVGKAYRAGVPILFGTDLGIFGPERSHEEFALLAAAGLPPEQVLRAATVNAAVALGRGDSLGSIAPGKIADIIAMKIDPITHIDQLGETGKVSFVMKEGQVFSGRQ